MGKNDRHVTMFFSVDLKNSTPTKENKINDTFIWPHFYVAFYKAFPSLVERVAGATYGIKLWKTAGDELLFYCDLSAERTRKAGKIVEAFLSAVDSSRRAIDEIRDKIENLPQNEQSIDYKVDLKCTIWCAPVPHRNRLVLRKDSKEEERDFVGPEIDLGFRLSAHATPNYPVICPITALLLLDNSCSTHKLFFNGLHTLKGFEHPVPIHVLSTDAVHGFKFNDIVRDQLVSHLQKACRDLVLPGVEPFDQGRDLTFDDELERAIESAMAPLWDLGSQ